MYIPKINKIGDHKEIFNFVRANNFGIMVNCMDDCPVATHIPMELTEGKNGLWTVQLHIAKANLHWKSFEINDKTLLIFTGPHAYISSSWYASVSVPTWNYSAVHLYGKARILATSELKMLLEKQIDAYEINSEKPSKMSDYEENYIDNLMRAVVGIEILVEDIQAKYKLSQNKGEQDVKNVIHQLEKSNNPMANLMANEMKKLKK